MKISNLNFHKFFFFLKKSHFSTRSHFKIHIVEILMDFDNSILNLWFNKSQSNDPEKVKNASRENDGFMTSWVPFDRFRFWKRFSNKWKSLQMAARIKGKMERTSSWSYLCRRIGFLTAAQPRRIAQDWLSHSNLSISLQSQNNSLTLFCADSASVASVAS